MLSPVMNAVCSVGKTRDEGCELRETFGVRGNVFVIEQPVSDNDVRQAVE